MTTIICGVGKIICQTARGCITIVLKNIHPHSSFFFRTRIFVSSFKGSQQKHTLQSTQKEEYSDYTRLISTHFQSVFTSWCQVRLWAGNWLRCLSSVCLFRLWVLTPAPAPTRAGQWRHVGGLGWGSDFSMLSLAPAICPGDPDTKHETYPTLISPPNLRNCTPTWIM